MVVSHDKADVVFRRGAVCTMDPFMPWAQAVAVKGDEIVYVGDDRGSAQFEGAGTDVVDLDGRMLLPGFISAHDHLVGMGWTKLGVDVSRAPDLAGIAELVGEHARRRPDLPVVKGFGWSRNQTGEHPTAAVLDAVVPDRPVALMNTDGHDAWFNTCALRRAGIDADTPDEGSGSRWLRDEKGVPDGLALEGAWWGAYAACGAFEGTTTFVEGIRMLMDVSRRAGLTGCIDMGVVSPPLVGGPREDMEFAYRACVDLDRRGQLPLRVAGTFLVHSLFEYRLPPEEAVEALQTFHEEIRSELVSVDALKLFADGVAPSHSACLLEPYADRADVDMESLGFISETLESYVEAAHVAGFDAFTHCDGDGAVRRMVDACERVFARHGRQGRRHSVEHCTVTHPDDVVRMARLGLQANGTPLWAAPWPFRDTYLSRYGLKRTRERLTPYRALAEAGVPFTFGSDLPGVQPYEVPPLFQVTAAVTQDNPGGSEGKLIPGAESRRWSLAEALKAYTLMGAYKLRREDRLGSLVAGKLADLVVLGEDLFTVDPGDIWEVPVLATMCNGRFTHREL
jgi:hypothetical protein